MRRMCLRSGTFLAGKPSRQTNFTAGNTKMCQRFHAKMGDHTGLFGGKTDRHCGAGCPHVTTLDGDSWASASMVVLM